MHPTHRGPEDKGGRESHDSGALARTVQLVAGEYLLTVNPVDGSEIEPCPPGRLPGPPRRRGPRARADLARAAAPPAPVGEAALDLPLLERDEERERLVRLLARGRSVRLTGPSGSGRTGLLAAVAAGCADLAPDGVVRLSGHRRGVTDLLYALYHAVHDAPRHRPELAELLDALAEVGAVVVLDDLEFGGAALDELLKATPECAFLFAATPDVPAPSADSDLEEVVLRGLSRTACVDLLERAARRPLTEGEADWAGDLWFESEGLPLRFVQAGALLRERDARGLAVGAAPSDDDPAPDGAGAQEAEPGEAERPAGLTVASVTAVRLAQALSGQGRDVLRFAVALDGEVPQAAHLPALLDDERADAALAELTAAGLATAAGAHYRLAAQVTAQLVDAGYAEGAGARARTAAQHYAWWAGHPSVTAERVAAESEAVLAAVRGAQRAGHASAAVLLAHTAAPVFAAAQHWSAWERVLTAGQEAARQSGEVAEETYFHHELGVLALCTADLDRARTELETAMALRGGLADRSGTFAGRRALALVADRSGVPLTPALDPVPGAEAEEGATAPSGSEDATVTAAAVTGATPSQPFGAYADAAPAVLPDDPGTGPRGGLRRVLVANGRRNVLAAAAGAVLAVVLGTVVTVASTSGEEDTADRVRPDSSTTQPEDDGYGTPETPGEPAGSEGPRPSRDPGSSGAPGATPPDSGASPSGDGGEDTSAPGGGGDAPDGGTSGGTSGGTGDGASGGTNGGTGDGGTPGGGNSGTPGEPGGGDDGTPGGDGPDGGGETGGTPSDPATGSPGGGEPDPDESTDEQTGEPTEEPTDEPGEATPTATRPEPTVTVTGSGSPSPAQSGTLLV
ncbi:ATP-binding protein [Streptomyces sp. TRM 70351]|uniref:ATP-binding protein n=1 Tax=Streptomyces sp. TRM 70351 TaxID=3116552 RepID=UPI002E7C0324|nr:ATP-binding protein [Streptomyces sp. TRM 70351]MEE1927484.1 ATP-binding protein [Streptomyces sp. TRM 70351]